MNQKHPTPKKASKSGLNKSLWIVIIAAVLLELISVVQYYSTRQILSDELERKEEMGLRMKESLLKLTGEGICSDIHRVLSRATHCKFMTETHEEKGYVMTCAFGDGD